MSEFRTGNGAHWLDFLVTRIGRYRGHEIELLSDSAALRSWLSEHGLEPVAAVTLADVEAARSLREVIHRSAVASLRDQPPSTADLRSLRAALENDQPLQIRRSESGLSIRRPADARMALGRLAREAAETLSGPDRRRLRACGDDTCAGIFLDHTGRRRWCSDERCGVRSRVRAHRARAATAPPAR